jgi:hypothetical protein
VAQVGRLLRKGELSRESGSAASTTRGTGIDAGTGTAALLGTGLAAGGGAGSGGLAATASTGSGSATSSASTGSSSATGAGGTWRAAGGRGGGFDTRAAGGGGAVDTGRGGSRGGRLVDGFVAGRFAGGWEIRADLPVASASLFLSRPMAAKAGTLRACRKGRCHHGKHARRWTVQ